MISLDSPVATVLGAQTKPAKAKKITDTLGIRTVGDLLFHFPRRYVETGELTKVKDLRKGQMLTLVGDIVESRVNTYRRPPHPSHGVPPRHHAPDRRPVAADVLLRQVQARQRVARRAAPGGAARPLHRAGQHLPRPVAADQPDDGAVRAAGGLTGDESLGAAVSSDQGAVPALPPDQGGRLLGPPARGRLRPHRGRRAARPDPRRRTSRPPAARPLHGPAPHPRTRLLARGARPPSAGSASRRPW